MYSILVKLDDQQKEELFKIRNEEGTPIAFMIRKAIDQYLENRKKI